MKLCPDCSPCFTEREVGKSEASREYDGYVELCPLHAQAETLQAQLDNADAACLAGQRQQKMLHEAEIVGIRSNVAAELNNCERIANEEIRKLQAQLAAERRAKEQTVSHYQVIQQVLLTRLAGIHKFFKVSEDHEVCLKHEELTKQLAEERRHRQALYELLKARRDRDGHAKECICTTCLVIAEHEHAIERRKP